ncbi:MAG: transporter substrate-binding domain-containing protein [Clostridia bacterium]
MKKLTVVIMVVILAITASLTLIACNEKEQVKVIEVSLTEEEYAFAVAKGNDDFLDEVNTFLAKIKADGTFDAILDKYFGDGTPTPVTSAAKDSSKDQLIVATNAAFPPFEYKQGNSFAGVDMEIAKLLADELGKELVIDDMEFDTIIPAIGGGNADIGMAGMTVNAKRLETVNFAAPYYNASQMIVTKVSDTTFDELTTAEAIEEKLLSLSNKKVGVQAGTTGKFYAAGDEDWGFDGFSNITVLEYTTGALAVQALINGNVDFVIIDEMPAKLIAAAFNG